MHIRGWYLYALYKSTYLLTYLESNDLIPFWMLIHINLILVPFVGQGHIHYVKVENQGEHKICRGKYFWTYAFTLQGNSRTQLATKYAFCNWNCKKVRARRVCDFVKFFCYRGWCNLDWQLLSILVTVLRVLFQFSQLQSRVILVSGWILKSAALEEIDALWPSAKFCRHGAANFSILIAAKPFMSAVSEWLNSPVDCCGIMLQCLLFWQHLIWGWLEHRAIIHHHRYF